MTASEMAELFHREVQASDWGWISFFAPRDAEGSTFQVLRVLLDLGHAVTGWIGATEVEICGLVDEATATVVVHPRAVTATRWAFGRQLHRRKALVAELRRADFNAVLGDAEFRVWRTQNATVEDAAVREEGEA